jgi:NTE family protein
VLESDKSFIGVALSGGAARGIAHISVLETLENEGIPIHAIAGTSAGSVVGALYAAGIPLIDIRHILLGTKWKNILKFAFPKRGLVSSEGIYKFMSSILKAKKFSALQLPFAAVATDLRSGEKVTITSGSVARAVQASCSLPIIFTPTEVNKRMLIDGGVSSQIPVRSVREELKANKVVAVDVNFRALESDKFDNIVEIATHLSALWASRNARDEEKLADVVIQVNARGIALYDLSKSKELLNRGRKAAEEKMQEIKALLREPYVP